MISKTQHMFSQDLPTSTFSSPLHPLLIKLMFVKESLASMNPICLHLTHEQYFVREVDVQEGSWASFMDL